MKTNKSLSEPFPMKEMRHAFWNDYKIMPFSTLVENYMQPERVSLPIVILMNFKDTKKRSILLKCAYKFDKFLRILGINIKL